MENEGKSNVPVLDKVFQTVLDKVGKFLSEEFYEKTTAILIRVAHYALYAAVVIGLLLAVTIAIKASSFRFVLLGLVWVVLLPTLQYVADKFILANRELIKGTRSQLSGTAFLNMITILALISGVAALVVMTIQAISGGGINIFVGGVAAAVILFSFAIMANKPQILNIEIVPKGSAGDEAIGIFSFLIKANYRMVPLYFSVIVIAGTVMMLFLLFKIWGGKAAALQAMGTSQIVLVGALVPLIGYLAFVFLHLVLDQIRALLTVPKILDKMSNKE